MEEGKRMKHLVYKNSLKSVKIGQAVVLRDGYSYEVRNIVPALPNHPNGLIYLKQLQSPHNTIQKDPIEAMFVKWIEPEVDANNELTRGPGRIREAWTLSKLPLCG